RRTPLAVARGVSWGIIPLVAGLFVVVAALDRAGALGDAQHLLATAARLPSWSASLAVAAATAVACNLFNNLPVALFAGAAIHGVAVPTALSHTVLVAVDLSPNLSLTGSLATLLWLIVLRREGIIVTPWQFVRLGALVTIPALLLAVAVVR
ncbi:MAG TPA: ArsB/NhaD family transporter, partial [Candidatus Baltobacteraceae bacterium]